MQCERVRTMPNQSTLGLTNPARTAQFSSVLQELPGKCANCFQSATSTGAKEVIIIGREPLVFLVGTFVGLPWKCIRLYTLQVAKYHSNAM